MGTSAIAICNIALSHVGMASAIAALTESSAEARACATHYDATVQEVLREHAWPFATRRVALALVATADGTQVWSQEWGFAYRFPANAVRLLNIVTGIPNDPSPPPFELGDDDQGSLVYTDASAAIVRYTHNVTAPAKFAADFAEAVGWKLATKLAMPLAVKADLRTQNEAMYAEKIARAKLSALNEAARAPQPEAEWVREKDD